MLRSYFAFASHGRVVLKREVLGQLGIGPDGVLYGALCPDEQAAILSPIPPRFWGNALKIVVLTKHPPGSLAAVAKAIAELRLDTISSWASNASFSGHLCSTAIVVADPGALKRLGGEDGIVKELTGNLRATLSDLHVLEEGAVLKVTVSPLAILAAYGQSLARAQYHRVPVNQHSMNLEFVDSEQSENPSPTHLGSRPSPGDARLTDRSSLTLWGSLLRAGNLSLCGACILTPDTEEALLRVTPVSEQSHLCRLQFSLTIGSNDETFSGYWQAALDEISKQEYSIFAAHNLIIDKVEDPPSEEAHFNFILDFSGTNDVGYDLSSLQGIWNDRLKAAFKDVASPRGDTVGLSKLLVEPPRGVGASCFVSTNAKSGAGARAAAELCKLLEGYGFRPVNVDRSLPKTALREQVLKLVKACRFMVVLYCPEKKLEGPSGRCRISDWVFFEESIMEAIGGQIYRFRFPSVDPPVTSPGFKETVLSEGGFDDSSIRSIRDDLENWQRLAAIGRLFDSERDNDGLLTSEEYGLDLVAYYEKRANIADE